MWGSTQCSSAIVHAELKLSSMCNLTTSIFIFQYWPIVTYLTYSWSFSFSVFVVFFFSSPVAILAPVKVSQLLWFCLHFLCCMFPGHETFHSAMFCSRLDSLKLCLSATNVCTLRVASPTLGSNSDMKPEHMGHCFHENFTGEKEKLLQVNMSMVRN